MIIIIINNRQVELVGSPLTHERFLRRPQVIQSHPRAPVRTHYQKLEQGHDSEDANRGSDPPDPAANVRTQGIGARACDGSGAEGEGAAGEGATTTWDIILIALRAGAPRRRARRLSASVRASCLGPTAPAGR